MAGLKHILLGSGALRLDLLPRVPVRRGFDLGCRLKSFVCVVSLPSCIYRHGLLLLLLRDLPAAAWALSQQHTSVRIIWSVPHSLPEH